VVTIKILGLAAGVCGFFLVVHAVIVLANNRGEAVRFWFSTYDPRDRNDPIFRTRRVRVLRSVGAALELMLGLGLIALGIQFLGASFG